MHATFYRSCVNNFAYGDLTKLLNIFQENATSAESVSWFWKLCRKMDRQFVKDMYSTKVRLQNGSN